MGCRSDGIEISRDMGPLREGVVVTFHPHRITWGSTLWRVTFESRLGHSDIIARVSFMLLSYMDELALANTEPERKPRSRNSKRAESFQSVEKQRESDVEILEVLAMKRRLS